jgi:molybdenum cofactor biosynthesis protein B
MTPHRSPGATPLAFGLLTVSDTRTPADDVSGSTLRRLVEAAGHRVHAAEIVPDEPARVHRTVVAWAADPGCDAVVASGGTGLSGRDRSVEAVRGLFEITIEGFGELFRMLSFEEVGSAAMLSRAVAGVVRGTPVFLLPGSPAAVTLGMERLVLPEIGHVIGELRRDR